MVIATVTTSEPVCWTAPDQASVECSSDQMQDFPRPRTIPTSLTFPVLTFCTLSGACLDWLHALDFSHISSKIQSSNIDTSYQMVCITFCLGLWCDSISWHGFWNALTSQAYVNIRNPVSINWICLWLRWDSISRCRFLWN